MHALTLQLQLLKKRQLPATTQSIFRGVLAQLRSYRQVPTLSQYDGTEGQFIFGTHYETTLPSPGLLDDTEVDQTEFVEPILVDELAAKIEITVGEERRTMVSALLASLELSDPIPANDELLLEWTPLAVKDASLAIIVGEWRQLYELAFGTALSLNVEDSTPLGDLYRDACVNGSRTLATLCAAFLVVFDEVPESANLFAELCIDWGPGTNLGSRTIVMFHWLLNEPVCRRNLGGLRATLWQMVRLRSRRPS